MKAAKWILISGVTSHVLLLVGWLWWMVYAFYSGYTGSTDIKVVGFSFAIVFTLEVVGGVPLFLAMIFKDQT